MWRRGAERGASYDGKAGKAEEEKKEQALEQDTAAAAWKNWRMQWWSCDTVRMWQFVSVTEEILKIHWIPENSPEIL